MLTIWRRDDSAGDPERRGNARLIPERRLPPPHAPWRLEMASGKRGRDAGSGQFIPVKTAQANPKTAVVETVKKPKGK